MAEIFSSTFNNSATGWTSSSIGSQFYFIGQDFTRCFSCGGGGFGHSVSKTGLSIPLAGTARYQFASIPGDYVGVPLLVPGGPYSSGGGFGIDGIGGPDLLNFISFSIKHDEDDTTQGQFIARVAKTGAQGPPGTLSCDPLYYNPYFFASDPIPNLHNGLWHGIQWNWILDSSFGTVTVSLLVDNNEVLSFVSSVIGRSDANDCPPITPSSYAISGYTVTQLGPTTLIPDGYDGLHYVIENVHVDNTRHVYDWIGITDGPELTLTSCDTIPIVESMICASEGSTIVISGQNFSPDVEIDLQGPFAVVLSFDILSITPTQIILGNLSPAIEQGETYCVTVTNPA